jgi:phosphoesterase RecJ-like protein
MVNSDKFQKTVDLINQSSSILLTTHTKPDGDACGCLAALANVLVALGKKPQLLLLSPMPQWYEFLFAEKIPVLGRDINIQQLTNGALGGFDLILIIDTNSLSQLPQFDQYLKKSNTSILIIDHHKTSDGLGDVELLDTTAAATGLIIFDFLKYAGWPITEKIAQALFVAIATDTGWFQFSNTDSRVFRSCAELIEAGANATECYHKLFQNFSPQRLKLITAMLNTLELHLDGRFATQYLLQRDFEQTGATYEDTENLINECQRISSVEVAALLVELKDGRIKCSLRSSGGIDVCKIVEKFGGGGHKQAAGAYLPGPLENAKQLIFDAVSKQFPKT